MIWSISFYLNYSELNFNVQNGCRSISKFAGFSLNFWWYSGNHFDTQVLDKVARIVFILFRHVKQFLQLTGEAIGEAVPSVVEQKSNIILSLSFTDKTVQEKREKTTTHSTDHRSDQLKKLKFYKNFSEYANFSKSSGKGHKSKGQIL